MKILFVHHKYNSTFIKNDLEILRKHYNVEDFYYTPGKTLQLFKKIKECDLIYIWFISYPAYLVGLINKLYKKPVILIAGGYGVQSDVLKKHRIFKLMVKSAIKNASRILAVSEFTRQEVFNLCFWICPKVNVVYNGVDLKQFHNYKIRDNARPVVITVGIINSWARYYLKGIDKFIEYARQTPDAEFYVIGMSEHIGNKIQDRPLNVHFYLPVTQQELVYFYNAADMYCQFSKYESFCLTLLEALACGCTVLFTPKTGMDEIFNNRNNLSMFSIKNREKELIKILNNYRKWY